MSDCEHKFVYAGLRYAHGANPLPGSGARRRYYGHVYFCERCCETRGQLAESVGHCTYDPPLPDSAPGTNDESCVPNHDRSYGY